MEIKHLNKERADYFRNEKINGNYLNNDLRSHRKGTNRLGTDTYETIWANIIRKQETEDVVNPT